MIKGAIVAMVTPFKDGMVDEEALKKLIEFQIENGTDGIVPCGTTGESATLSYEEHERVIELTIETVNKRIPVIAGTGSNSTREAIALTKHAEKVGADAALLITPYYNKPTQDGLYHHFKAVSEEVSIPLILYNVPSRTGVNLLPETVARLKELKNIYGIKEATGDLRQVSQLIKLCGKDFVVLSGDDFVTLPMLAVGAKGVISVTSNIIPKDVAQMVDAFFAGDFKKSEEIHYKMWDINVAMFLETNPIPVKTALGMMGMITPELRLPLVGMSEGNKKKLQEILQKYKLI